MANSPKYYDIEKVGVGLAVFVLIVLFPFFYNHLKAAPAPELKLTEKALEAKQCVRSKAFMKAEHMQLLDHWRDTVVRDAERMYVSPNGETYNMSLSNTCMTCHSKKEEFCDRCHDYASVRPYCWDCHIDNPIDNPEETE